MASAESEKKMMAMCNEVAGYFKEIEASDEFRKGFIEGVHFMCAILGGAMEVFENVEIKMQELIGHNSENQMEKHCTSKSYIGITFGKKYNDALEVMNDLREMLSKSKDGYITVGDLYSHNKVEIPFDTSINTYGWRDLTEMHIDDGDPNEITLVMPKAEIIGTGKPSR